MVERSKGLRPRLPGLAAGSYRPPFRAPHVSLVLDGNEGQAPPIDLGQLLAGAGPEAVRRYPNARRLEELLALRHGLRPENVLATAGADDALDRCLRAYAGPGNPVVAARPTFEMVVRYARLARAEVREVPWTDGPFPREGFIRAAGRDAGVLAVVTPNNPTGLVASASDLSALSAAVPEALLLVDLAYGDFADEDLTAAALALPNAVVLRSFSKAGGLAGLRSGYALGPEEVIGVLRAAGQPYALSMPAIRVTEALLGLGNSDPTGYVSAARAERVRLNEVTAELGLSPLPSQANFVCCITPRARRIHAGLMSLGISVRHFAGREGMESYLRITCPGREQDMDRLEAALRTVVTPEALLFDMDGVLADVSGSYHEAIVAAAASFGITVDSAMIREAKQQPGANNDWVVTQRLLAAQGCQVTLDEAKDRFEAAYQGTFDAPGLWTRETLLPRMELLVELSKRMPLGIVTGRPRYDAERFLERTGIGSLFATVVCMEDAPLKPDPAPVRLALSRLGVSRAWLVGDTPDDLVAARGAGVLPLAVLPPAAKPGIRERLAAAGAAEVMESLEPLMEMIA